ncbi:FkbM family methyltransferase [Cohaesibacter sp. ES.047]|uniref:FkbM family methyltransferase n=1 Tax=Cohaesibacter sp. ES.047 TaxID=1798205 RepID=UPI0012FDEBAE|nr:FkbM family methyltransferase [Cohaesibacter sp. ES.047]
MKNPFAKLAAKTTNSLFKRTKSYRELCARIELLEHLVIPPMTADAVITLRDGAQFHVPNHQQDIIQKHLLKLRNYVEFEILESLKSRIQEDAIILDIGANIGNHAVYWGRHTHAKHIYCFEPVPETFSILERNVALNALEGRVDCHNFGLGNSPSKGSIAQFNEDNIGGTKIKPDADGTLEIRPLEKHMQRIGAHLLRH